MDFEFNFGQSTVQQGVKKNEKRYASVAGVAVPLSGEELAFLNRENGENQVMTHEVLHALSLCQEFKPLHDHINTIMNNIPQLKNQTAAVEKVTEFLIKNQLLIEDKDWLESISKSGQQSQIQSAGLVVRTCDRPNQLERMLKSLEIFMEHQRIGLSLQFHKDLTLY